MSTKVILEFESCVTFKSLSGQTKAWEALERHHENGAAMRQAQTVSAQIWELPVTVTVYSDGTLKFKPSNTKLSNT